ncbi:MAG: M28 family peptidase [Vicinamibacteraceae bacterium]
MTTRAALPGRLFPSRQSRRGWPLALVALGALLLPLVSLAGCSRQSVVPFRVDNARAHLDRLTNAGPRPTGSAANVAARAYLIDQLRLYGFDVRTQTVDASRPEYGRTMRVSNIVATRAGSRQDAIALVAHYDSVAVAPGAMDDGIGTAVALEAARLLAAAPALRHTLVVLLTDGEEFGLMGAVGAMTDAELRARLKGYVNLESTGSTGPAILFESGPGNEALIRAWAGAAPHPHGASYVLEIYKRLPNDTDFSILKAAGIPGLNFAPVGNSHTYHTSRDTADRVSSATLLHMGETTVTTMRAMDALDRQTADRDVRFASVGESTVIILADWQGMLLAILAIGLGLVAWIRIVRYLAAGDAIRFIATALWGVLSLAAAIGAMVGASWLLVTSSAVHHPWYASPMRTLALIAVSGALGPWLLTRVALLSPERVRYIREPASVWALTLPVWGLITAFFEVKAPLASPIWAVSLALAGAALAVVPPGRTAWMRGASVLVLAVTALLFLGDGVRLYEFLVAVLGRLPIVTPVWVLPLFVAFVGVMIVPPVAAALIGFVEGRRGHGSMGGALLAAFALTLGLAYMAPAYTPERPARRSVVYVHDTLTGQAWWEVAGNEPGLDLAHSADQAARWRPVERGTPIPASVTVGAASGAFRYRRQGEATPAPARVVARIVPAADSPGQIDYEVAVTPQREGLGATLHLPTAIVPVRATPVGAQCRASWCATYLAIPPEGMTFRVRMPAAAAPSLASAAVTIGSWALPGSDGRRPLPWLPQERTDWTTYAQWVVRPESAAEVPVEAVPGEALPNPSAPSPPPGA